MKRRQFITLLGGAAAWPVAVQAQQVQSPPDGRVIVIGEGSVSLTPDYAQIESGVTSRARTIKEASDANSKLMGAITSALLESGIEQKDVQTSRFSVQPVYAPQEPRTEQKLVGYSVAHIYPVMLLHLILFPVNIVRLVQIRYVVRGISQNADLSMESILPFMEHRRFRTGETLMRMGEQADRLFYLVDGQIEVVEIRKTLSAGTVIGEIGVFARHQQRIATVVCLTDCELYELSARGIVLSRSIIRICRASNGHRATD